MAPPLISISAKCLLFIFSENKVSQDNILSQIVASFYILLVMMLVWTNLGMMKGRRRVTSDKESSLQSREGERIKCQVVGVGRLKEGESKIVDNV